MVAGIESAVDVAAGGMHTAVLDSNGKVCPRDQHQVSLFLIMYCKKCFQFGPEWTVGTKAIQLGLDFWVQRRRVPGQAN